MLFCRLLIFFFQTIFQTILSDPDQALRFVRSDLGLQLLSVDNTGKKFKVK